MSKIKPNIGDLERLLRIIIGIYTMLLGFMFIQGLAGNLLGFAGLLAFVTGAVGWCGMYTLLGKELPATEPPADELPATPVDEPQEVIAAD